jgi:hypothetical protein
MYSANVCLGTRKQASAEMSTAASCDGPEPVDAPYNASDQSSHKLQDQNMFISTVDGQHFIFE